MENFCLDHQESAIYFNNTVVQNEKVYHEVPWYSMESSLHI